MEGKRISDLTEVTSVPTDSYTIIVDGTDNKKIKLTTITKNLSDKSTNLENRINTNETEIQEINTQLNNINTRIEGLELSGNLIISDVEENETFEIDDSKPIVNVTGVTLNKSTTTVPKGSTETLTVTITPLNATNKNVTWSTSNSSIATVNNGVVTGVANGNCNITVTTEDGNYSATCGVIVETINIPVESITLNLSSHTLKVDETIQLMPTFNPSNATNKNVTWSSNNGNCTVVDGLVTGIAEGESIITCTTVDGNKTATCTITVNAKVIVPDPQNDVIYEEDGYLCVPVEKFTIAEISAYSRDNFKVYQINQFNFKSNRTLIDTTQPVETILKDVNISQGTWDDVINSNNLTEMYATREGYYIAFKILNSNVGSKTIEQYFKDVVFSNYVKFKLKSTVNKFILDETQLNTFRLQSSNDAAQYCRVNYPSVPNVNPSFNFNNWGFKMNDNAVSNFPTGSLGFNATAGFIEFKFNPNTFTEFTLEKLKEYLSANKLIIWLQEA